MSRWRKSHWMMSREELEREFQLKWLDERGLKSEIWGEPSPLRLAFAPDVRPLIDRVLTPGIVALMFVGARR